MKVYDNSIGSADVGFNGLPRMSISDQITGAVIFVVAILWGCWLFGVVRRVYLNKNETKEHPKKLNKRYVKIEFYNEWLVVSISASICAAVVIAFLQMKSWRLTDFGNVGQIGDFIGGLTNPLLSFAALVVLLKSITMQAKIIKVQSDDQALSSFRDEFYTLLNIVETKSQKMSASPMYLTGLDSSLKAARTILSNIRCSPSVHEAISREIVLKLIEFGLFEKYALSVRMAMRHVITSKPADMDMYGIIIRDSMSDSERVIFLTWVYYYWRDAKYWFKEFHDADGKITSCEFTRGLKSEDFISDEVFKFF
ncbi:hypothetical protein F9Z43_14860 [Pseudomonas monteilii]|uniref:Phage abortive infection protein n=1 Tax=Pseudomonas monteilii TaxID=76759 RepID=A0A7X3JSG5_9PSED|nr:hypothetical protein [Pseudomonas monteilii]MVF50573.1 hypothetical protein [Pseudomonas monteilii]